jgi:uncharacterized protein YecE (DUF72 family)
VAQLQRFFEWAPRDKLRFAWEPRHLSWTPEMVRETCRRLELIHAVDPLESTSVHGSPQYFRLHGTPRGQFRYDYDHPYSVDELHNILTKCRAGPTYCLFNNKQMATDATSFEKLVGGST